MRRSQASFSLRSIVTSLIVFATAAFPIGVAGLPLGPRSAQSGIVIGTVAEQQSLQPIAYATVRIGGTDRSVTTNESGQFRITDLAPGAVQLEVAALGYETISAQTVTVPASGPARVTIAMTPAPLPVARIIVTATKTARSAEEIAALTSLVEREDIEAGGDIELVDALEGVTGIMRTVQAGSFESLELRGMPREGNEFESTLLLIDGVPQTDSRNSARVINLPLDNADAVEVVHGPNSALYGRTAIGGAVNVITAQPTPEQRTTAEVQVGEFGHLRGSVVASGPVRERAGYLVSWSSSGNEGFYQRDAGYDVDETSVYGKFTFAPDDRSQAMFSVNNVTSDNSLPTSVPVIDGEWLSDIEPGFGLFDNINLPTANYHQEELRLTSTYTRELGSAVWLTNVAGYRDIQYKFEESGDIVGAPFDFDAKTLTTYPFSLQSDEEIIYEELRFAYRPTAGRIDHELLVGGSYESTTGYREGDLIYTDEDSFGMFLNYLDPVFPPRSDWVYFPFGGDDYSLNSYGLYYQYQIRPYSRLQLTAAGRFDRLNLENIETFQEGRPKVEESFDAFSPKFSALYRLVDGAEVGALAPVRLNVFGAYSEAFKPPRTPHGLTPPDAEARLDPEDITNYEVGLKASFAEGRASLQATYFQMERDGIVVSTREGPFFRDSNAGKQEFEGVELAGAWAPEPRLTLRGNAAVYNNRFGDFVIQEEGDDDVILTGNRLVLVPDLILNLGGSYELADGLLLSLDYKHVGDRYSDQNNTLLLDSYDLLDASLSLTAGPVRLTVSGHNVLDEEYITSGDASSAESVTPAAPRQLVFIASFTN